MRRLFNLAESKHVNFYNDILEPLFYDALNRNRGEQGYCPALHCRIPFLSGGLFEPIDGYDWEHNEFSIPNEVFSNVSTKGRDADGILDIFDRYNFTMSEDEPMEREVAIDPEMLGKVFENLLEVNDRKSKGAFYTPREIVHYMCQESLINYLTSAVPDVTESDIRDFILYGDLMKDEDTTKEKRQGNGGMYISDNLYKIDNTGSVVVDKLKDIDIALKNVRIADPAVGSGAFPLGMLNEIVRARQNISAYKAITMKPYDIRFMYQVDRSPYILKRDTIQNCIFASDIEPSAVDIAQLRLWLALVIDDEINPTAQNELEGHRNPLPLPNLESNIVCGNSLNDEFDGIPLVKESDLLGNDTYQTDLSSGRFDSIVRKLIDKQNKLFLCDNTDTKRQLKEEIESLRNLVISSQLEGCSDETMQRYSDSTRLASKPYVLWQLDFARVFREKGGFDIVIGNPPYIQLQKEINAETGEKLGDQYADKDYQTFAKTGDIYCLFYEKGYRLLHPNGVLAFITSNKWMRAGYGEKLRKFFAVNTNPKILIDFAGQKIFESATVDVNILLFEKAQNMSKTASCIIREKCSSNLSVYVQQNSNMTCFTSSDSWTILSSIEAAIKQKIEAAGIRLKDWNVRINRGILTGCNEAFIISGDKRNELISQNPKSAEIIRPILRGRDIKRYGYTFSDLWVITSHNGIRGRNIPRIHIDEYPAIKAHLDEFYSKLCKRADKGDTPYNLRNCAYMDDFSKQKIVWGNLCLNAQFAYVEDDYFINAPSPMIVPGSKYLLAVLNSKVADWYIRQLGVTRNGGYFEYKPMFVEKLPIPPETRESHNLLEEMVDKILAAKKGGTSTDELENCIDQYVYSLYGLDPSEIRYIESQ